MKPAVLIAAVLFGLFRPVLLFVDFNSHIEAGYEAFAHLFVGGLIGAWLFEFGWPGVAKLIGRILSAFAMPSQAAVIRTVSVLSWIEIICAAIGVAMKRGLL